MKKYVTEFVRRGASACGLGPVILAVLYTVMFTVSVNGDYFSIQNRDAFNFGKGQFPHFVFPISQDTVRTGITPDEIFDLLC